MSAFVARQAILNSALQTIAYELLFRSSSKNEFPPVNGDAASLNVMDKLIDDQELGLLTSGKTVFINFTHSLIVEDYAWLLPKDSVVIEVVEKARPDAALLGSCLRLKSAGYRIALDDVHSLDVCEQFSGIADIIKVDFLATSDDMRRRISERYRPRGVQLLAEKVETFDAWKEAEGYGYSLFQGYYFCKPMMLTHRNAPTRNTTELLLLKEVARSDFEMDRVERIFKQDPVYALKLLKLINSAAFGLRHEVRSIRHALMMLGLDKLRKWVLVLVYSGFCKKKSALLTQAVVRARFCENVAPLFGQSARSDEVFMMGLFSLIDAIVDQDIAEILKTIAVSPDVESALLGTGGPYLDILEIATAYERAEWDGVEDVLLRHDIAEAGLPESYLEAVGWAGGVVDGVQKEPELVGC